MIEKRRLIFDFAVFVVIRTIVFIFQVLPLAAGYSFARRLAQCGYQFDKRHRRVAFENLRHAFPDWNDRQRERLVRENYLHFAMMIIEMLQLPRRLRFSNARRFIDYRDGSSVLEAVLDDSRPTIIVTGHFGNWELAGFFMGAVGVKSFAIARTIENPFLEKLVRRLRQFTGQTILSKNDDYDKIQAVLERRGVLVSLADQAAGPKGYFVDFFHRPASTHRAIALLALQFDARILVSYAYRLGRQFRFKLGTAGVFDSRAYQQQMDGAMQLTRDYTAALESAIRLAPTQYFWLHNRWKHQPIRRGERRRSAS